MSRAALLLLFMLALSACSNPYEDATKLDTIEAYETFIQENPDHGKVNLARARLAELKLEQVKAAGTLEAYDAFIKEFPKGKVYQQAMKDRKPLLLAEAEKLDTPELWGQVVDDYGKGDRKLYVKARRKQEAAEARKSVALGTVTAAQVNMAGDAKGALDGWKFTAPITNNGTKPAAELSIAIRFAGEDGAILATREWPVVAKRLPEAAPLPEGFARPMEPGETRTWTFMVGNLPEGWKSTSLDIGRVKWVEPAGERDEDEGAEAAAEGGADGDKAGAEKKNPKKGNKKREKKPAGEE